MRSSAQSRPNECPYDSRAHGAERSRRARQASHDGRHPHCKHAASQLEGESSAFSRKNHELREQHWLRQIRKCLHGCGYGTFGLLEPLKLGRRRGSRRSFEAHDFYLPSQIPGLSVIERQRVSDEAVCSLTYVDDECSLTSRFRRQK